MSNYQNVGGMSVNLDPTASPQISSMVNENQGSYAPADKSGEAYGRGLLDNSSSPSAGIDQGTMNAIKSRANQRYNLGESQLDVGIMKQANADKINHLLNVSQLANTEVEQNRQKALLSYQIQQANRRARGQILGSVLGITGGIIGGVAGSYGGGVGAAAGASAGYAAGSGAGQMIGQGG